MHGQLRYLIQKWGWKGMINKFMKKLSVIIPLYNEKRTIKLIVAKVLEIDIPQLKKEVIIVDDFSTDGSREIVRQLEENPSKALEGIIDVERKDFFEKNEIKCVYNEKNEGKSFSLKKGINLATGDIIIIQDADLEYNPEDYHKVLKPIIDGEADVVYGSRFRGEVRRVLFFWHSVGNKFLTALSNAFTNLNLTDMETCYKAFRADVIKKVNIESKRFGFEPEITAKVAKMGCRIYEVPISYHGRNYKEGKKITWKDGFEAIYYILKYNLFSKNVTKKERD